MSLSERNRAALYHGLCTVIDDEEAVDEMLSHFPARDAEEPATKDFVRAEVATLRADMRTDFHSETQRLILWFVGANTTMLGIVLALTGLT
jgi:hypothetical protein